MQELCFVDIHPSPALQSNLFAPAAPPKKTEHRFDYEQLIYPYVFKSLYSDLHKTIKVSFPNIINYLWV